MRPFRATASAVVEAPPELVYGTIADYHKGHPSILPTQYFISLEVEQGGVGAGTVFNCRMKVFGNIQSFRAVISEPEPGRVIVETGLDEGGVVTTFVVEPVNTGKHAAVTITTDGSTRRRGVLGSIEGLLATRFLERVYRKELRQLARVCEGAMQP